ncbi:hypothetical protein QFZ49_000464 [Streptomyces turgidiscabies]|uniref:Uncharacterized protein n=1 Tax=Streptomyces turgidiscabies TaxID=85558 RepID=A0ABU0RHA6_9ACTN|nr:hypothetical protein [Streptomyces turgidiscabies]
MGVTQGIWSYASVLGRGHTGMSGSVVSAVLALSSVVALAGAVAGPLAVKRPSGRCGSINSHSASVRSPRVTPPVYRSQHPPEAGMIESVIST